MVFVSFTPGIPIPIIKKGTITPTKAMYVNAGFKGIKKNAIAPTANATANARRTARSALSVPAGAHNQKQAATAANTMLGLELERNAITRQLSVFDGYPGRAALGRVQHLKRRLVDCIPRHSARDPSGIIDERVYVQ